jgi:hypothetical protein
MKLIRADPSGPIPEVLQSMAEHNGARRINNNKSGISQQEGVRRRRRKEGESGGTASKRGDVYIVLQNVVFLFIYFTLLFLVVRLRVHDLV